MNPFLRGRWPVDFKDLRKTAAPGRARFRRRLSVVVRTAISVQKKIGGRESDLKCLPTRCPSTLHGAGRSVLPAIFKSQRGLTLQEIWHCFVDETWHQAVATK